MQNSAFGWSAVLCIMFKTEVLHLKVNAEIITVMETKLQYFDHVMRCMQHIPDSSTYNAGEKPKENLIVAEGNP